MKEAKEKMTATTVPDLQRTQDLANPDFIKVEKNLSSLGFFTPTSKRAKKNEAKTICQTRLLEGKRVKASVSIEPSLTYGLPTTADQDKLFAFYKLVADRKVEGEPITNPVAFTTAEMLRVLGKRVTAGKNYEEIEQWLRRMTLTGIVSEGTVYLAGKRAWASDIFHVFDRSVSLGRQLPDGTIADRNYVWLSEWQLENINHNHLLPVDFDAYKQLKNHIAKALVPLLQVWLFASEQQGVFEKSYADLAQHLKIRPYVQPSRIREQLSSALEELVSVGYLASWIIERTSDGRQYKVVFEHGAKFFEDRALRAGQRSGRGRALPQKSRKLPAPRPLAAAPTAEPSEAERLVRSFHQQFYKRGERADPLAAELKKAEELISKYGFERASQVVPYALRVLKGKNYKPDTFNGIAQYAAAAVEEYDRHREDERKKAEATALANVRRSHEEARRAAKEAEARETYRRAKAAAPTDEFRAFTEYAREQRARAEVKCRPLTPEHRAEYLADFESEENQAALYEHFLQIPEALRRKWLPGEQVEEEPTTEEDSGEVAALVRVSLGLAGNE